MKELEKKIMNKVDKALGKAVKLFKRKAIMTNDGYLMESHINLANEAFLGLYIIKLDDDIVDYIHQIIEVENFYFIEFNPSEFKKSFECTILNNTNLNSYYKTQLIVDKTIKIYDEAMSLPNNKWSKLSENLDYNEIFVDNLAKELKPTNDHTLSVTVSKSLFPNVTKTVYDSVLYNTEIDSDYLDTLNIKFHIDGCNIFMRYYYLINDIIDTANNIMHIY